MAVKNTWVVVADAGGARILSGHRGSGDLETVAEWTSPEGRGSTARKAEHPDRPPRVHESHGPARHAIEPHTRRKDVHAERLAVEIGRRLSEGLAAGAYEQLILAAPPRFAGQLNAALDDEVDQRVIALLRKDLRHEASSELYRRLEPLL